MALIDIFDNNAFAHDPRIQFFNWALMAGGASDYAADARGYTVGSRSNTIATTGPSVSVTLRSPRNPTDSRSTTGCGLTSARISKSSIATPFGDARERAPDAISQLRQDGRLSATRLPTLPAIGTPAVADVRRDQTKLGLESAWTRTSPATLGLFGRYSWNDGRTETYAFAEIDRSLTAGLAMRGRLWFRPRDTVAVAFVQTASRIRTATYLAAGGLGNFLGDGWLNYRPERVFEAYYSFNAFAGLWLTLDGQYIMNPGYNADRGPVNSWAAGSTSSTEKAITGALARPVLTRSKCFAC
jgi:high affinity Mn2+ porin